MSRRRAKRRAPTRFGKHQLRLLSVHAGAPLLEAVETGVKVKEKRGPRRGLLGAWVEWAGKKIWIPGDTIRRMRRRKLYKRGGLTDAALSAYLAYQTRRA